MKKILRLFRLHPAVLIPLAGVAAALLIYVFTHGMEQSALAYAAYPLSAYALTAVIVTAIPGIRRAKDYVRGSRRISAYMADREKRMRSSLRRGLFINVAYAAVKFGTGVYLNSVWFGAVGVYYMVLSVIRFLLVRGDRAQHRISEPKERYRRAWKSFRTAAWLVLLLNVAMSGMAALMIRHNEAFVYPGVLIYASAAYTFYRVTMAVISSVRYRSAKDPILSAAKYIDMCVSLMSLYALQSAMIVTFGSTERFRLIMNSITGTVVCAWVVLIGIYMLAQVHKKGGKYEQNNLRSDDR